jgi:prepilin-type N-terminal cleavage/methylation domain-containing protein
MQRQPARDRESGLSLVEMVVAMAIVAVALGLVVPIFEITNSSASSLQSRANEDAQLRLALVQLESEISSAQVLYATSPPAGSPNYSTTNTGVGAGFALLVLSDLHGNQSCIQWRLASGNLQERSWQPSTPPTSLAWETVASGLTNSASLPPFQVSSSAPYPVTIQLISDPGGAAQISIDTQAIPTGVGSASLASSCETIPS